MVNFGEKYIDGIVEAEKAGAVEYFSNVSGEGFKGFSVGSIPKVMGNNGFRTHPLRFIYTDHYSHLAPPLREIHSVSMVPFNPYLNPGAYYDSVIRLFNLQKDPSTPVDLVSRIREALCHALCLDEILNFSRDVPGLVKTVESPVAEQFVASLPNPYLPCFKNKYKLIYDVFGPLSYEYNSNVFESFLDILDDDGVLFCQGFENIPFMLKGRAASKGFKLIEVGGGAYICVSGITVEGGPYPG